MQERARRELQTHLVALAQNPGHIQGLDRRFRLAGGVAEGGEVVQADQQRCGLDHRLDVERLADVPDAAAIEGGRSRAVEDAIEITSSQGGESRVELGLGEPGVDHRDRLRREMGVDRLHHHAGRPVPGKIDMNHLSQRVHAGIGAASRLNADRLTGKCQDRRLDRGLNGRLVRLGLEAAIGAAVVLERQSIAGHQPSREPAGMGKPRRKTVASCGARPSR